MILHDVIIESQRRFEVRSSDAHAVLAWARERCPNATSIEVRTRYADGVESISWHGAEDLPHWFEYLPVQERVQLRGIVGRMLGLFEKSVNALRTLIGDAPKEIK